jgi:hypothetical protein
VKVLLYVGEEVIFSSQKCAVTLTIRNAYHLYFGCQTGDQDKCWAPHCCAANLESCLGHKRLLMPFMKRAYMEGNLVICNDVDALVPALNINHNP